MATETIWKYPLEVTDRQTVTMPRGAEVLCAQLQHGAVMLWAKVDPRERDEKRTFLVVGTGHPVPLDAGRYVGTVMDDPFVWHVFEDQW